MDALKTEKLARTRRPTGTARTIDGRLNYWQCIAVVVEVLQAHDCSGRLSRGALSALSFCHSCESVRVPLQDTLHPLVAFLKLRSPVVPDYAPCAFALFAESPSEQHA